jgi:hypothetical protein
MSIDIHEEPWLREALAGLVTHEPPMDTSIVSDVRRGEQARVVVRRRRTSFVAIAVVLAVVAVPLSLLLRSGSTVTPGVPTPTATGLPTDLPTTIAGLGWSITDTRTSAVVSGETDYSLRRTDGSGTTTHLWLVVARDASGPGHYLAQCTHQTCDVGHAGGTGPIMGADRNDHGHDELGAHPRTLDPPGFGSLILDWSYRSGTVVEAVSLPATTTQSAVPQVGPPSPALSLADLRTILTSVGDPFALPPVATLANHTPVYVPDSQWAQAVSNAIPGSADVTVTDPGSFEGWKTGVVRMRLQRGGTTTSVVVSLARVSQCLGTCAGSAISTNPPCPVSGSSCTVLRPWTVAPADGADRRLGVIEQTLTGSEATRGYTGTYVLRTGVQLFGPAQLSVESDSREPGATGQWLGSSAPGLTADELLTLARDLPLPESWRSGITSSSASVSPSAAVSHS